MGVENIVLRNRWLTNAVMSRTPPDVHATRGKKYALNTVKAAMRRTSAYPDFVRSHGMQPVLPAHFAEFQKLPVTSKENYIDRYSLSHYGE